MGSGGGRAVVVMILILLEGTRGGNATQHVVGGNQGWDVSTDLSSWASGRTFIVGDQLVFKYTAGLHSVVELESESAYKNCDTGSGVVDSSMNGGGKDVVKLSKPGTRYFACGTPGHCAQGMKLKIHTISKGSATANTTTDSSSDASSSSSALQKQSCVVYLILMTTLLVSIITIASFSTYSNYHC